MTCLPGVEVERREFAKVGIRHVHIEGLGLIYEGAAIGCHVNQRALLELPHRLVQCLQVIWDVQALATIGNSVQHTWQARGVYMGLIAGRILLCEGHVT